MVEWTEKEEQLVAEFETYTGKWDKHSFDTCADAIKWIKSL